MRAGTTNRSSPLVKSSRRIQKARATARPHLLPHPQNPTSVLPSGPTASGPAHRRTLQSSLKLSYTGEPLNAPSVSSYVWFPTSNTREAHLFFFFLISFWLCLFGFTCPLDLCRNPHSNPRHPTPDRAHVRLSHFRGVQYYPTNINYSRCCDQAICTECFVQIKRSEPTTTHLVSEPAACPYCVQEHFGVVYTPPPWRTGIGGDGSVCLPVCSLDVGFGAAEPVPVRRLCHGQILLRGHLRHQRSRGHVAVRVSALIALRL